MRVFSQLVYDTDRNLGNVLISEDWHLWMIDFTRAFRNNPWLENTNIFRNATGSCWKVCADWMQGIERKNQGIFIRAGSSGGNETARPDPRPV